jgi:hypothetical protein
MSEAMDETGIRQRWEQVGSKLDERGRRLWAAAEVQAAGHGALKVVSRITGLARSTINRGEDDLDEGPLPDGRVRRKGGGGKPLKVLSPEMQRFFGRFGGKLSFQRSPTRWVDEDHIEKAARARQINPQRVVRRVGDHTAPAGWAHDTRPAIRRAKPHAVMHDPG